MFQRRYRQPRENLGVILLAYHLLSNDYIPPVTLAAILFQVAIFLGFIPSVAPRRTLEMCLLPSRVLSRREWIRMLASVVMHADDMHLYYNMVSLLWKGRRLERRLGSWRFLLVLLVFAVATSSTVVGLSFIADEVIDIDGLELMQQCAVGFSGVLFALKVLHTSYFPYEDALLLGWLPIPSRYVCWAELLIIQMISPNASFIGHLAGILVGSLYVMGPLRYIIDFIEALLPLSFGLRGEESTGVGNASHRRESRTSSRNRFTEWGSGTFGESAWGDEPNYGWRRQTDDYEEYTGGLSEEEQMRRATEESLRHRAGPTVSAPPYPEFDNYGWRYSRQF